MEFFGADPKELKIGDKIEIPTQKKLYDVTFPVYKAPSTYTVYAREKEYIVERASSNCEDISSDTMRRKS